MWRSIAILQWALSWAAPQMSHTQQAAYAQVLQAEGKRHHIDPLDVVVLIRHESRWHSHAVSQDGEDLGLGQIRARFDPACRKDQNPVDEPSPECHRARQRLLDPIYNLRRTFAALAQWRTKCRTTGSSPSFRELLEGYGGLSDPSSQTLCGKRLVKGKWRPLPVHPKVQEVLRLRKRLQQALHRRSKSPKRSAATISTSSSSARR